MEKEQHTAKFLNGNGDEKENELKFNGTCTKTRL